MPCPPAAAGIHSGLPARLRPAAATTAATTKPGQASAKPLAGRTPRPTAVDGPPFVYALKPAHMPKRYFTVEEANAALATLRPIVATMLAARGRIVAAQPDLWPVLEKAAGNGGSDKTSAVLIDFEAVRRSVKSIERL